MDMNYVMELNMNYYIRINNVMYCVYFKKPESVKVIINGSF